MNPFKLLRLQLVLLAAKFDIIYRFCVSVVDWHDGNNNHDHHANGEIMVLREILPEAEIVFDIGANVGHWAKAALSINPNLKIHCFEPSLATFRKLSEQQFPDQVSLNRLACGAYTGNTQMYINWEASQTNSIVRRSFYHEPKIENISQITIDDYCRQHRINKIDYIKIDVEGYELEVLKGMKELLTQKIAVTIQFEYGRTYLDAKIFLKDIWDFINTTNLDYLFFKITPNKIIQYREFDNSLENFQLSNWLISVNQLSE
jgi:FkbM family methyltransferase